MKTQNRSEMVILMADDDPGDVHLTKTALAECNFKSRFLHVPDGEKLLRYLKRLPPYETEETAPRPDLILLDLNMPCVDGRTALAEIKSTADLRRIPVVILTTSQAEDDILKTYDLGANSYVTKPVTFDALLDVIRTLESYWFQMVALPG